MRAKIGGSNVHQAIMKLTDDGTNKKALFSKPCVHKQGTASMPDIKDYLIRYTRAGFVKAVGFYGQERRVIYCITDKWSITPSQINRAGKSVKQDKHQKIWVAVRKLKSFTRAELLASSDAKVTTVKAFLQNLKKAKIIELGANNRWILRDDIGPLAPQILKSKEIYNPNNDRILNNE